MQVIGSRKRGLKCLDGEKIELILRRLQCQANGCKKIHHELPDKVVPYKRHESQTIEKILDTPNFQATDCPCEHSTANRVKSWYSRLQKYFEGTLRALMEIHTDIEEKIQKSMQTIQARVSGWLCLLVRMVVNSGRWVTDPSGVVSKDIGG